VVLTDGSQTGGRPLLDVLADAVEGGARSIVVREKHLPREERAALAGQVRELLTPLHGELIVASDPSIPADGVHLASADPAPAGSAVRFGRSCHSAADVGRAAAEGCSWVTLSPVFPTPSKPGYGPAIGPGALGGHPVEVWALGGVEPANAAGCLAAGASRVAVMGSVMRAPDPAGYVAALCGAVREVPA
jgi:thiamine-phosphate diphosphorylase